MFAQAVAIAAAVLAALVPVKAELVEQWYTGGIYPPLQRALTTVSNLVPFAWMDVALVVAAIWLVRLWWTAWGSSHSWWHAPRAHRLLRAVLTTAAAVACVYLVFLALWGLNYRRVPLARQLVLDKPAPSTAAVVRLGLDAVGKLNTLHEPAHGAGWDEPDWKNASLRSAGAAALRLLARPSPVVQARLKRSMLGLVFRWNGVDGMTNPFGLEVLANPDLLPFERPFVAAHEWAHLAGYADESDANFVGWLTCLNSDVPAQYSAWLYLYWQIAGELGSAERPRLAATLAAGPRGDLDAITARLRRGDIPLFRRASWAAYDQYLKANHVQAGVRSYGEVVTLILRARFEDGWRPVLRDGAASRPAFGRAPAPVPAS